MKRIVVIAGLLSLPFVTLACAAGAEDALSPPAGSNLLLAAHADGVQVYVCTQKGDAFAWVFDGPSASLFNDRGRQIGVHGKGPIWTLWDGSGVTGELIAKKDAAQAGAVPWLLLKVKEHVGTYGTLSNASYVRRIDTTGGGEPEDGCDAQHQGDIARIRYSGLYQFYGQ